MEISKLHGIPLALMPGSALDRVEATDDAHQNQKTTASAEKAGQERYNLHAIVFRNAT